ncbi:MAG: hypothetical protein LBQ31_02730 [Bacteroidales bacterium]|nr:hypothetical protein [Bacteroidales bacterium]
MVFLMFLNCWAGRGRGRVVGRCSRGEWGKRGVSWGGRGLCGGRWGWGLLLEVRWLTLDRGRTVVH